MHEKHVTLNLQVKKGAKDFFEMSELPTRLHGVTTENVIFVISRRSLTMTIILYFRYFKSLYAPLSP